MDDGLEEFVAAALTIREVGLGLRSEKEGMLPGRDLIEDDSQRPQVRCWLRATTPKEFGSRVRQATAQSTGALCRARLAPAPGEAEIHELALTLLRQEEVLWLDISMHDLLLVQGGESEGCIVSDPAEEALDWRALLGQEIPQGVPLKILHHQEDTLAPLVFELVQSMDVHEMIGPEARAELGFLFEPLECGRIAEELFMEEFERKRRSSRQPVALLEQLGVEDPSLAADTQLFQKPKGSEVLG